MSKIILITFSGREDRMQLLKTYISRLIDKGYIDEWHVWDFTRSASDRKYIRENYGEIRYIRPNGGYQKIASVKKGEVKRIKFRASSDFHFAFKHQNDTQFTECVAGGWSNSRSAVRKLSSENFDTLERSEDVPLWTKATSGLLNGAVENILEITFSKNGFLRPVVNSLEFPDLDFHDAGEDYIDLYVRAGWGHSLELLDVNGSYQQFIGDIGEPQPYFQAYQYYAERYTQFRDDIFLKCDDDIVYVDEAGFSGFVEAIQKNRQYFIISGNVVNNGICAYLQQKNGQLPEKLGIFECPPGGVCGSLWESGEKAYQLHEFFVETGGNKIPLESPLVEWSYRNSINFIGWHGEQLRYMYLPKGDDEHMLTVEIPEFLNKKTAIYSDFMVAHLSFFPQEKSIKPSEIISLYQKLL